MNSVDTPFLTYGIFCCLEVRLRRENSEIPLSRPKAGFQRAPLHVRFHHVSDNHQNHRTLAQNERASDGSRVVGETGTVQSCRAQKARDVKKFRSYGSKLWWCITSTLKQCKRSLGRLRPRGSF